MKGQANWSPMQKLLFTSLVPIAAAVGTLLLFSFLRSQEDAAPQAESGAEFFLWRCLSSRRKAYAKQTRVTW